MDCCQCQGIESKFDQEYAKKKLIEYREKGPKKSTQQLIEVIAEESLEGAALLDIGGGVGDIQHALLKLGVSKTINAEASQGYLEACMQEAERQGHADKIQHINGNFVDLANEIPSADIVTLDRVICCYDDMEKLVELSVKKANRLYGVVYPRDKWWVKLGSAIYFNFKFWLQRNPFRTFIHPTKEVEEIIYSNGFIRSFHRNMGSWQVVLYSR